MSTVYNGQGTLVTPTTGAGIRRAITAIANTTPIQVTVTAHGFNTGDSVEIENAAVADVNGWFQITRIDANTISLNGTIASGASAFANGYAIDYELQPAYTIPAQGELADAGVVGAVLEGLANPAPYLYRTSGKFRLYDYFQSSTIGASAVGNTQWSTHVIAPGSWVTQADWNVTLLAISDTPSGPAAYLGPNDMLVVTTTFCVQAYDGSAATPIGCGLQMGAPSPIIRGAQVMINAPTAVVGVSLTGAFFPTTDFVPANSQFVNLVFYNYQVSDSVTINLFGAWTMQAFQYRKN